MRYRICHHTHYEYPHQVSLSQQMARMTPKEAAAVGQKVLHYELLIDPEPDVRLQRTDFYGNEVTYFALERPHAHLDLKCIATVETAARPVPFLPETPPWDKVRDDLAADASGQWLEAQGYSSDSALVPLRQELAAYALQSFPPAKPIGVSAQDLMQRIYRDFKFDSKATTISTPVMEVFEKRRGVCQDFAHLMLAMLRSLGLAARYVSGYLETIPPAGRPRLVGADASHAWVSVFVPGSGWIDFDPTNNVIPGERHITLAWGRDYYDVSPLRGVLLGGYDQVMKVTVDVEPLAESKA